MQRRLGFIDVGARGGAPELTVQFGDRLHIVMIEPEPAEYRRLQAAISGNPNSSVIGTALAHVDGHIPFHETVNPTCSSVLKVNHDVLDRFSVAGHFSPRSASTISCSRYDTLFHAGGLPVPHIVKVDVQGFEYQVLQGFGGLLSQCLAIQVEAHFYPIYCDQNLIGDIVRYLSPYDFGLRRISNVRNPRLDGDPHFDGELVEVDAVFTKTKAWFLQSSEQQRSDLALACDVLEVPRFAA